MAQNAPAFGILTMRKFPPVILAVMLLAGLGCGGGAEAAPAKKQSAPKPAPRAEARSEAPDPAAAAEDGKGKEINGVCAACHGEFGQGGKCVEACTPRALERREGAPPWQRKALIEGACLAMANVVCRACGDACPERAIRFRPKPMAAAQPEVIGALCTGCGACVAPCPARAVRIA